MEWDEKREGRTPLLHIFTTNFTKNLGPPFYSTPRTPFVLKIYHRDPPTLIPIPIPIIFNLFVERNAALGFDGVELPPDGARVDVLHLVFKVWHRQGCGSVVGQWRHRFLFWRNVHRDLSNDFRPRSSVFSFSFRSFDARLPNERSCIFFLVFNTKIRQRFVQIVQHGNTFVNFVVCRQRRFRRVVFGIEKSETRNSNKPGIVFIGPIEVFDCQRRRNSIFDHSFGE